MTTSASHSSQCKFLPHKYCAQSQTTVIDRLALAGRVLTIRTQGKLVFYTIRGSGSEVQIICAAEYDSQQLYRSSEIHLKYELVFACIMPYLPVSRKAPHFESSRIAKLPKRRSFDWSLMFAQLWFKENSITPVTASYHPSFRRADLFIMCKMLKCTLIFDAVCQTRTWQSSRNCTAAPEGATL